MGPQLSTNWDQSVPMGKRETVTHQMFTHTLGQDQSLYITLKITSRTLSKKRDSLPSPSWC